MTVEASSSPPVPTLADVMLALGRLRVAIWFRRYRPDQGDQKLVDELAANGDAESLEILQDIGHVAAEIRQHMVALDDPFSHYSEYDAPFRDHPTVWLCEQLLAEIGDSLNEQLGRPLTQLDLEFAAMRLDLYVDSNGEVAEKVLDLRTLEPALAKLDGTGVGKRLYERLVDRYSVVMTACGFATDSGPATSDVAESHRREDLEETASPKAQPQQQWPSSSDRTYPEFLIRLAAAIARLVRDEAVLRQFQAKVRKWAAGVVAELHTQKARDEHPLPLPLPKHRELTNLETYAVLAAIRDTAGELGQINPYAGNTDPLDLEALNYELLLGFVGDIEATSEDGLWGLFESVMKDLRDVGFFGKSESTVTDEQSESDPTVDLALPEPAIESAESELPVIDDPLPDEQATTETPAPGDDVDASVADKQIPSNDGAPYKKRGDLFRSLHTNEGLAAPAIVDKWNALSDEERKRLVPSSWKKLPDAEGKQRQSAVTNVRNQIKYKTRRVVT